MQESFTPSSFRQQYLSCRGRIFLSILERVVVQMMTTIETYVRTGKMRLRKLALDSRIRLGTKISACFLAGFFLSAASLSNTALPLSMGLVCALTGWRAAVAAVGAVWGYLLFWASAGYQGVVWVCCGLGAALGLGKRRIVEDSPLLMSAIAGLVVSATGLAFQIFRQDPTSVPQYLLRIVLGALSAKLFELVRQRRDTMADALALGAGILSLGQVAPLGFSLGYLAAGAVAAWGALPMAALAGLALDLSRLGTVSMTAVLCLSVLIRNLPLPGKWVRYAAPGAVYILLMQLAGSREYLPFFGLALGGGLAVLLPEAAEPDRPRSETGMAQVRLELMATCLNRTQQLLLQEEGVPIDEEALLLRTQERACGSCPNRKTCRERLAPLPKGLLHSPLVETASLSIPCKKPGRLILELRRTQEQYRSLRADRQRQQEYRTAVVQQYRFLAEYLQQQADRLPRRTKRLRPRFTPEVTVCTAGREATNGDRYASFPGPGCKHYLLLCDGMGTGLGAAQEGQTAMELLRQMLTAGFPAEYALRSVNSMLVLRGRAAAVTMDLAQIHLDSGKVCLYKWGAAPSYLVSGGCAEKIGTATPPPGLSVSEGRETVERLSLRRGEVLILVSDGVELEAAHRRIGGIWELPPGVLAAELLEQGAGQREDDATVVAVVLTPGAVST